MGGPVVLPDIPRAVDRAQPRQIIQALQRQRGGGKIADREWMQPCSDPCVALRAVHWSAPLKSAAHSDPAETSKLNDFGVQVRASNCEGARL